MRITTNYYYRLVSPLLVLFCFSTLAVKAQLTPDLQKVLPLSPEAAAFTKYGEVPVGHFTGIPQIDLPLYKIQSKELVLDLSLSYHAGGNKVEDVPSWIGMGWSLTNVPSISRAVRGMPDEAVAGVRNRYDGRSADTLIDIIMGMIMPTYYELYYCPLFEGNIDLEADIYYFSIPGKSGRLYWNQKTGRYQTSPYTSIKINPLYTNGFEIIDDNGTIYHFTVTETTQTSGSSSGTPIATSWYASRVYNANRTDSLVLTYATTGITTKSINSQIVNLGTGCVNSEPALLTTSISSKNIQSIGFANGTMIFNRKSTGREDLQGGRAIDYIELFDKDNQLKRKWRFEHTYLSANFSDAGCSILGSSTYEKKRLLLNKVINLNLEDSLKSEVHEFEYKTTGSIPCRVSYAQDFWGYFNGKSNTTLVPRTHYYAAGNLHTYDGANRLVDAAYSQFGILTKIKYPTGGSTSFVYESNEALDAPLPSTSYRKNFVELGPATDPNDPEPPVLPPTNTFTRDFEINNPPDVYLNNNQGGALIDIVFGSLGCELNGQSQTCATLTLEGLDSANSHVLFYISSEINGLYVPNGMYRMKAVFNQNPPLYQNYYYIIGYEELNPSPGVPHNKLAGGLRIKQIINNDGMGNIYNKFYKYVDSLGGSKSSGILFGPPIEYYSRMHDFACIQYPPVEEGEDPRPPMSTLGARLLAETNATLASHNGNYVGYKTVFEYTDEQHAQGITRFDYSHLKDVYSIEPPYPPPFSFSEFRGEPIQTIKYKKDNNLYKPVSKTINQYAHIRVDSLEVKNMKTLRKVNMACFEVNAPGGTVTSTNRVYTEMPMLSLLTQTQEILYDQFGTESVELTKSFFYDDPRYRLSEVWEWNSKNEKNVTHYKYPEDLSLTGTAEAGRLGLIGQNRVAGVLVEEKFNNTNFIQKAQTNYKQFFSGKYFQEEVLQKTGSGPEEPRIRFNAFSASGNLLTQQKVNDALVSYIYGYQDNLPIAEITNASKENVFHTSFEDSDGNNTAGDAKTGTRSRTNGFNKTLTGLSNGEYILSYWRKTSNIWSFNSATVNIVNNSYAMSIAGQIDEVRFYPKEATMVTFTYDPLYGITSRCDASSMVTYYEYDGLGRLWQTRDHEGKILTQHDYKFNASVTQ